MFLTPMLVGYAASKFTPKETNAAPWYDGLFGQTQKVAQTEPSPDETNWDLGAEAWVTVPAQRDC